jgi:hypothetical protein
MFSWLSKLTERPQRREDDLFGTLIYMDGYWEGAGVFPPTQTHVEYFVAADYVGPTEINRRAFQQICHNYPAVLNSASAAISSTLGFSVSPGDLALSSMDIPASDLDAARWDISFTDSDSQLFSVTFNGLHATGEVDASS